MLVFPHPASRPALFVILMMALLASCGFQVPTEVPLCVQLEQIPLTPLADQSSQTVFETAGTIIAIHGFGVAKLDSGGSAMAIKVEQSVAIPPYANRATVFLNGWKLNYLGDNQHVLALGTVIGKIRVDLRAHTLTWNALGLLRDDDGEEGYSWIYKFTVVAWNDANLNAIVDQGVVDTNNKYCTASGDIADNCYHADNEKSANKKATNTALSSFVSLIQNNSLASTNSIAALPRGFGLVWNDHDHHLRQLSYNLDHSEILRDNAQTYSTEGCQLPAPLPNPPASHADSGFMSWNSDTIFKDDDTRRGYTFAEMVSGMGGADVGVLNPPFSILPADNGSWPGGDWCGGLSGGLNSEDFVIENIPFEYAIPMLTGWDLQYDCGDQHVKEIGIYIEDWSYQPPAGGSGGTLHYKLKSILADNDGIPFFFHSHKVTVLGLRHVSGKNVPPIGKPK
jgi:hypothetical protein